MPDLIRHVRYDRKAKRWLSFEEHIVTLMEMKTSKRHTGRLERFVENDSSVGNKGSVVSGF